MDCSDQPVAKERRERIMETSSMPLPGRRPPASKRKLALAAPDQHKQTPARFVETGQSIHPAGFAFTIEKQLPSLFDLATTQPPTDDGRLDQELAADFLRTSVRTLQNLRSQGKLGFVKIG